MLDANGWELLDMLPASTPGVSTSIHASAEELHCILHVFNNPFTQYRHGKEEEQLRAQFYSKVHKLGQMQQLDGVGPVDNRPSTNKLHPFTQRVACACDIFHVWDSTLILYPAPLSKVGAYGITAFFVC